MLTPRQKMLLEMLVYLLKQDKNNQQGSGEYESRAI